MGFCCLDSIHQLPLAIDTPCGGEQRNARKIDHVLSGGRGLIVTTDESEGDVVRACGDLQKHASCSHWCNSTPSSCSFHEADGRAMGKIVAHSTGGGDMWRRPWLVVSCHCWPHRYLGFWIVILWLWGCCLLLLLMINYFFHNHLQCLEWRLGSL